MIGTITLHHNANYGANLQAYALVTFLKKQVDEKVQLIDYRNDLIRNLYRPFPIDVIGKMNLRINMRSCKRFVKMGLNPVGTVIRDRKFLKFRKKYIPMSKTVTSVEEIRKLGVSHYFIGSDQIWNDAITADQKELVFWGNVKTPENIVSTYAASFGRSAITKGEDDEISTCINNFDFLSVRESSMLDIVGARYQKDMQIVCDPVFLLNAAEWDALGNGKRPKERYVFVYILENNPEIYRIADHIAQKLGLKVIICSDGQKKKQNVGFYDRSADPRQFLNYIKYADYVVTNSFHGTVFSMLFHKRFVTIPDTKKGIRMVELLNKYDIPRLCYSLADVNQTLLDSDVDYDRVDQMIEAERAVALEYICKVIKGSV